MAPSEQALWAVRAAESRASRGPSISLGILARVDAVAEVLARCETLPTLFAEAVVLADAGTAPCAAAPPRTRLRARPLDGHFGAQRTALARLSRTAWMLQLDADETLTDDTLARLPSFLRAAERDGVAALGLPRRNRVDGVLSDHYPDPQYRLCRRTVSYEGRVHERPRLLSRARQSRLALGLHIEHALDAERVRARTLRYGAMSEGATDTARRPDERALLTPFSP